jgi:hypothetical protein
MNYNLRLFVICDNFDFNEDNIMNRKLKLLTAGLMLAGMMGVGSANAATVSAGTDTFGYTATNWTRTLSGLSQFNPALGTLNSVTVSLTGDINQSMKAENTGGSPDTLIPVASGTIAFRNSTATTLVQVLPTFTGTGFSATAYDNTPDFGGTSGKDFGILSATATQGTTLTTALLGFVGTSTLASFDVRATGNGTISSTNGNIQSAITTQARSTLTLTYNYTPAGGSSVPEPASLGLMALGVAGLAVARRRKAA